MARPKKNTKSSVKVQDLTPKTSPKGGGRKAGEKPQEYLVVKMNDILVT
jgi:hypothetical protein